jgi:hypothetical protein
VETDEEDGSASFDAARYHRDIVRPLRATPRQLPMDLRVRYDIHDPLSDEVLARHLDEVIGCWLERSREQPDYSRAVYVALLNAHRDLLTDSAVRLGSAAWWSTYRPPERRTVTESTNPPLSDSNMDTVERLGRPLDTSSSDILAQDDPAVIDPLDDTVDTTTAGAAGDASVADTAITNASAIDRQLNDDASADRVRDLRALRIGDDVELSWVWPGWATEAIVSWDSERVRRSVYREKYRQTGRWRATLSPELSDGEVMVSVAVRGSAPNRREWSEAVSVMAPRPRQVVTYRVRRLWYRFPSRAYTIMFHTDRPPAWCDIIIAFSGADAFPETTERCKEIAMAYLASDVSTRLIILPRSLGSGWLRCFLVTDQSVILKDPDVSTLRIRSWIH